VATIEMRDVSPGGHLLSEAVVEDLPVRTTLRQVLDTRVRAEVDRYNRELGPTYRGLVQPEDAIRFSDGFRMRAPRRLDADHLLTAVQEAVTAGVVVFEVEGERVGNLGHELDLTRTVTITTVMVRPIVARRS
jgi:hypothetical protein